MNDDIRYVKWKKKRDVIKRNTQWGRTLFFGTFLPIYVNGRLGHNKDGSLSVGSSSVYGFENGKWEKAAADRFESYEVMQVLDREDCQLNAHLIGSDTEALRFAMVLMHKGEPIDKLKEIYDLIHAEFANGMLHQWEPIIEKIPSLKDRFERNRPERQKISKRLFGTVNPEYERLVQNIRIKSIDRIPENQNKNTFDFIHVEIRLSATMSKEERMFLCKKYKKAIGKHILIALSENSKFRRFSVPINILRIERATIGMDATLYVTLGIKDMPGTKQDVCG